MAERSTTRTTAAFIMVGLLVAGAFLVGFAGRNWNPFAGDPYEEIGPVVIESVQQLSQLVTVEMVESTTIEKGNDFGWLNWARGDRIFMFAVARIGAGVDLSRIYAESFEVDTDTGHVRVRVPEPEIVYVSLDNDATQVIDRDTGLFTKGDARLESDARQAAEELLVEQAVVAGIYDRAFDNAATVLREFLTSLGYEQVEVVRALDPSR